MYVHDDIATGGEWYSCCDCRRHGDMIELLGEVWDSSPEQVIYELKQRQLLPDESVADPAPIREYEDSTRALRQRAENLWRTAQSQLAQQPQLATRQCLHTFSLRLSLSADHWAAGPSQVVGLATREQVESVLGKKAFAGKGKGWDRVIICPTFDQPGRICGFYMVGEDPDNNPQRHQRLYRPLAAKGKQPPYEGGLAGLEALWYAQGTQSVVAVSDWYEGIKLQLRHFQHHLKPLPLVIWQDDGRHVTRQAWDALSMRRIIFWSDRVDENFWRQVVGVDGWVHGAQVSFRPLSRGRHREGGRWMRPHEAIQRSRELAVPWPNELSKLLRSEERVDATALLERLEGAGQDVNHLLRQCEPQVRKRLQKERVPPRRSVAIEGSTILEQQDGWFRIDSRGRRARICSARCRVSHAVRDPRNGKLYYRGLIWQGGDEGHFIEPAETLEQVTFGYVVQQTAVDQGVGYVHVSSRWKRVLFDIAVGFHEPEYVEDDIDRWIEAMRRGTLPDGYRWSF